MEMLQNRFKEKEMINKNPLNFMNKTFSFPKTLIKIFPKVKGNISNKHLNQKYSSKLQNRIWSSQNIMSVKNELNFIKNPIRNNLYSSSSIIYRAPSVRENRYKIGQLIKKEKMKKMNYFNNIHNEMLINESKLYRKKLYLTGFKSFNDITAKIELKRKYNMKDMIEFNDNEKKEYLNIRSSLKRNSNKNKNEKSLSGYESSLTRYKYYKKNIDKTESINKNKRQREIPSSSTYKTNYITKYSKLKSGKQRANDLTKSNETNILYSSLSKSSTSKLGKKSKINLYYELAKNKPKLNSAKAFLYQHQNNNEQKLLSFNNNNIEMSKMALKLNELIFDENPEKNKNITDLEKNIILFRTLNEFQIIRLDEASKQDIKSLDERISLLKKNIKKYNEISVDYFLEIQEYIAFLNEEKLNLVNNFESEHNKKFNSYFDLEKLIINSIIKQKELERLIIIKYFLLQVKFNLIRQPDYFNTKLNELSHKYELARFILGLKFPPQNQHVEKFLDSIPELSEERMNILTLTPKAIKKTTTRYYQKKRTKNYSKIRKLNTFNKTNIIKGDYSFNKMNINNDERIEDKIMSYLDNNDKIIFETPEEFMELLSNLEKRDLRLMQEFNILKKHINRIKRNYEYESLSKLDFSEEISKDITIKEETLKILKEENEFLSGRYEYITNNENKISDNENKAYKLNEGKKGFIVDLDSLKSITYHKIIEKYKKKGSFMFEKILISIKNFLNLKYNNFDINIAYELVDKDTLDKILKLNSKTIKNLENLLINKYTLLLLKIYEKICQFVIDKDIEYNSIEKNKNIIREKKEEIQLKRKLKNSRNIRQLAEEKRMEGIKNIKRKDLRINSLLNKKLDENIVLKNKLKKSKSTAEKHKNKINFKEREFKFYINYE